jgi:hypothetical protein
MSSPGLLADRDELEGLFVELADELLRLGLSAEVVMVGGSWMLWHSQRAATRDVDSARRFEADLSEAVRAVGARHGLGASWLNDSAAGFWPAGASLDDGEVVFERGNLRVRTPPPEIVFVMKLYRAHPLDREDLVSLWPLCDFGTPEAAVESFRSGYPHAPEDEHLVDFVRDIADDATPPR